MKQVRCAIYTRKSSEEGLEQNFNSLHAQREACTAYVMSQASEGWTLLPDVYDDGGLSGGTLDRPALKRLLGEVEAGHIDIIVVYKVDRLTRSLLDFARLVETFDRCGTSFVSITQSFNTTNSMGRLTLNMLLSFAQFEREVTAERIRDKLAASKAKGMWMGGIAPLGYRPSGRTLVVVEDHAALVREIFTRYRTLGNVRLVTEALRQEGVVAPRRKTVSGRSHGGVPFSRGQIYALLRNPIYIGCIGHRGVLHKGLHAPIIERETWDAVQRQLAGNVRGTRRGAANLDPSSKRGAQETATSGSGGKAAPANSAGSLSSTRATASPLAGRIVDQAGLPLIATHARKGEVRYRYYVSKALQTGIASPHEGLRIPAREIEQAVVRELAHLLADPLALATQAGIALAPSVLRPLIARCKTFAQDLQQGDAALLAQALHQVRVHSDRIEVSLDVPALAEALALEPPEAALPILTLSRQVRLTRTGRAVRLVHDSGAAVTADGVDLTLVKLIHKARAWWQRMATGKLDVTGLAQQENVSTTYVVRVLRLAFLSPAVVEAVLDGRLRAGIDANALFDARAIRPEWDRQEKSIVLAG